MTAHLRMLPLFRGAVAIGLICCTGCGSGGSPTGSGGGGAGQNTAAPLFNPAGGNYASTQLVTLSDTTPAAAIYYTTDGTVPTASSTLYTGAIRVSSPETIKAAAIASGYTESAVATAAYTFDPEIGTWTWMGGSNTANSSGVYGTLGVPAVGNVPAPRAGPVSWIDGNGNFWLFGGQNQQNAAFNDLWEYNPTSNLWTWMSGSSAPEATGVYGTKGSPSAANVPAARYGAVSWTDASGKLWLFGGANNTPNAFYNDLWRFDPNSNLWTWMSGSSTPFAGGVYGVEGVASAGNVPGARNGAVSWSDGNGNLWLFGGGGYASNGFGGLNDLWEFSTTTLQWTWVSGSNLVNQPGVYGTQGSANAGNLPGAREWESSSVKSSSSLWLFGGWGSGASFPFLNDLWVFNTTTNQWAWISGSSAGNAVGVYGTRGTPSAGNTPGSRMQSVTWTDAKGNLWLFGGDQYVPATPSAAAQPNDLWQFNTATNEWTWMNGVNTGNGYATYGSLNVPSAGNAPGGRAGAVSWTDSAGNLWMFGGTGMTSPGVGGCLNDLWRYSP